MNEEKIGFGFQSDEDESLKSKSGFGLFGLNTGVIQKFEYTPASKDDTGRELSEQISVEIKIGESVLKQWWMPVNKVFGKNGEELDSTHPDYTKGYNEQMKHFKSVMTHYLKTFISEEALKAAFSTPISSFGDFAKLVCTLMAPAVAEAKPIDVFLQYQWKIKEGNTMTFLELPKNLKDGSFITASMKPVGAWKEVRNAEGLSYVDDAGNVHRFKRSKSYLESPKAIQQKEGQENSSAGNAMNTGASTAAASTW